MKKEGLELPPESKIGTPESKPETPRLTLEKRPAGPDCDWYLRDVVKAAKKEGARLPGYEESLNSPGLVDGVRSWKVDRITLFLHIARMENDWGAVLRGDKKWVEVSDPQYCFDNLLLDSKAILVKTVENAEALSTALREVLPLERQRYLGRSSEEYTESVATVKAHEWVSQQTAADFLAPYLRDGTCSKGYIRRLAREKSITRHEKTGKIKSSSLIDYSNNLQLEAIQPH